MKMKKLLSASIFGLIGLAVMPAVGIFAFAMALLFGGGTASGMAYATGIFDPTGLTLYTDNAREASQLVYKEKFQGPSILDMMSVEEGIKHDKAVVILGAFDGLAGSVRAACDTTPNTSSITNSQKTWSPKHISDRFVDCYDNLETTFWKLNASTGLEKEDLEAGHPAYTEFVRRRLSDFISADMLYQKIWFGNTSIAAGGTNALAADQLKYFNAFSGLFAQLETAVATTSARRTTIGAENTNSTYATQVFAAASSTVQPATDYLNTLVYASPLEVRLNPSTKIFVTQSFADQYAQERTKVTGIPMAYERTESGMRTFSFQGYEVIPIPNWDRIIRAWFANGTKYLYPHRALMIPTSNMILGLGSKGDLSKLDSFYDKYSKNWVCEFAFDMDVKLVDDGLFQYAY